MCANLQTRFREIYQNKQAPLIGMGINIGKKIKEVVNSHSMSVTTFAKKINKSRTVVYHIFNRQTVDSGLLVKIGQVLSFDFLHYYSSFYFSTIGDTKKESDQRIADLKYEITLLRKLHDLLDEKKQSEKSTNNPIKVKQAKVIKKTSKK